MFRKTTAALVLSISAATAVPVIANAAGVADGDWTGPYIYGGVNFNSNNYDIVGDGTIGPTMFDFNLPDLGGQGVGGTIGLGYDFQVSPTMVVGGFLDYTMPNNENDTIVNISSPGPNIAFDYALTHQSAATLGARVGYLPNPSTLIYGLVGYNWSNWDGSFTLSTGGPPVSSSYSFSNNGISVGAGIETMINQNFSLALEYRYTKFDDYDLLSIGPLLDLNMETSSQSVIARAAWRF